MLPPQEVNAMARSKGASSAANRPSGSGSADNRSGQGAGSALREMLRRQAKNPRPGAVQGGDAGREKARPPALPPERKQNG